MLRLFHGIVFGGIMFLVSFVVLGVLSLSRPDLLAREAVHIGAGVFGFVYFVKGLFVK